MKETELNQLIMQVESTKYRAYKYLHGIKRIAINIFVGMIIPEIQEMLPMC